MSPRRHTRRSIEQLRHWSDPRMETIGSTRLDISPLFGCTDDSPVAESLLLFRGSLVASAPKPKHPVQSVPLFHRRCPTLAEWLIQAKK